MKRLSETTEYVGKKTSGVRLVFTERHIVEDTDGFIVRDSDHRWFPTKTDALAFIRLTAYEAYAGAYITIKIHWYDNY